MITRFSRSSALAALLTLAGVGAAQAQGPYAGASLGSPDYKSSIAGVSGDGGGVGGKLYGGYEFTPNFALEGGYVDLGHIDDASGKVDTHGLYVDAVGRYEFMPKWSVLGRAGLTEARFKTSNGDDSSPGLKLGAGVQYDLSNQVALRAEYEHYHFSDAFDSHANVGEMSFGVKVGF